MNKIVLSSILFLSVNVNAHTLDFLPDGLIHEILHAQFILIPLAFIVLSLYLLKRGRSSTENSRKKK